jgi:hypothetical protein
MPDKLVLYLAMELQCYETGAAVVQLFIHSTFNKAVSYVKDF